MVLEVHSDTSYLSEPKASSQAGGNLFLAGNTINTTNNGAVLNMYLIIKAVMTSESEIELCTIFINAREAVTQCKTLEEMVHPHPPKPKQTDNSTAMGVVKNII